MFKTFIRQFDPLEFRLKAEKQNIEKGTEKPMTKQKVFKLICPP